MDVSLAVLDDVRRPGLRAGAVDLERAHDQDVLFVRVSDVEAGLHAEPGCVDEVGVIFPGRDEDDRCRTRTAWLTPAWSKRLDVFGVAPQAGGFDPPRGSLQQRVLAAGSPPPLAAAL